MSGWADKRMSGWADKRMIGRGLLILVLASAHPPARLSAQVQPRGPLAARVRPLLDRLEWRRSIWGALVVSLSRGDTLLALNADHRFVPASNAKLFTTAAALHYLGADYRFLTVLFADGAVTNGELFGDLVLFGTGDPTFAQDTTALAPFADSVVLAGIRRVRGDIVGDASFLGAELTGPGWSPDFLDQSYAAPPSALGAAENRVRLTVTAGPRRGAPARVRAEPESDYHHISSTVLTGQSTGITVRKGNAGVLEVSGTIAAGAAWSTWVVVDQPAVFAAGLLRQLLERRGVRITGVTRSISDDATGRARLMLGRTARSEGAFAGAMAVRRSAPLGEIVTMINHRSHNLSAELALRSIGRVAGGSGSFETGARLVAQYLTNRVGIPATSVRVTDGSGLSILDETSPRALVRLLRYQRRGADEGPAFYRSLPVLGAVSGRRLSESPAARRVRAKTGTLNGVSALSGYINAAGGEELAFSLMVNFAPSIPEARAVQDSIVEMLAAFSRPAPEPRRAPSRSARPAPRPSP